MGPLRSFYGLPEMSSDFQNCGLIFGAIAALSFVPENAGQLAPKTISPG